MGKGKGAAAVTVAVAAIPTGVGTERGILLSSTDCAARDVLVEGEGVCCVYAADPPTLISEHGKIDFERKQKHVWISKRWLNPIGQL